MLALLVFAGIVGSIWLLLPRDGTGPSGQPRIIDGDSIRIGGETIRLVGIDAPEGRQLCRDTRGEDWACGRQATRALRKLISGRDVQCTGAERDRGGRLLAVCRVGQREINRWMVEEGWAVSYNDYPKAENQARAAKKGIWSGTFLRPRDWRDKYMR
ncbi:MAG: thermonuclease family protein [Methyloligellaceae bacterium]